MRRRAFLAVVPAVVLAACSSPDPFYFTLQARPGQVLPGGPRLVEIRRIGLAGYLDRPEIVRTHADYRLDIVARDRWGEPLGGLVARVLAEDLTGRMPGSSVFTSAGSISADPDASIEIDLQRFDADADGRVVVLAQVAVLRGSRASARTRTIRLSLTPAGPTTTDLVASLSAAVGQMADQIAQLLRG